MKRTRTRASLMALATLLAGIPATAQAPVANTIQPASQGTEKQAPVPVQATQQSLQFLADLGAPLRRRTRNGYYWPGRRAAAALRTAGKTRRMR